MTDVRSGYETVYEGSCFHVQYLLRETFNSFNVLVMIICYNIKLNKEIIST